MGPFNFGRREMDEESQPLVNSATHFLRDDEGQDVVEYGLLVATIGLVVLAGTAFFGGQISSWFSILSNRITTNGT